MNPAFCLLISLLMPFAAQGQDGPSSNSILASTKLIDDVNILKQIYESAHPGLYRYNTKAQMDAHFAALKAEFARDRTLADAFIVFSQFLAKIKCGHTYANFFNQPKDVAQALFAGKNRVPFCFRWIGGRMIVTRDLSPQPDAQARNRGPGDQRHPASEILARLMTIARADGSNDAKRLAYLEVQGTAKYEAFDIFLPLFFPPIGEPNEPARARAGAGEAVTITVDAHALDPACRARKAEQRTPQRGDAEPLWRFEQLDDRTAYLRMPSWALYNSKWDWRAFLDRGFDDLIDRRGPGPDRRPARQRRGSGRRQHLHRPDHTRDGSL